MNFSSLGSDGATEKFALDERWAGENEFLKKTMLEHARDDLRRRLSESPPLLIPASPGHELVHFDTGGNSTLVSQGMPTPAPSTSPRCSFVSR